MSVQVSTHHYTPCPVTKGRWLYERWLALRDVSPDDLWDYLPDDERAAWDRLADSELTLREELEAVTRQPLTPIGARAMHTIASAALNQKES